jgi:Domain of unknown function (DUF397)
LDLTRASWRKSSYSSSNGGNCVEIASLPGAVAVRDSKNPDDGTLVLSPAAWRALVARVKAS